MQLEIGKSFARTLKGRVESYEFEVGILDDKAHRLPLPPGEDGQFQTKNYAGGKVIKAGREPSGLKLSEVLIENMKRLRINLLKKPFERENSDIIKFTRAFIMFAVIQKGMSIKRVENLLQAIVRNPILKQEYGKNKAATADVKGFDRHLFATGQMFQNIKARAKRVRR